MGAGLAFLPVVVAPPVVATARRDTHGLVQLGERGEGAEVLRHDSARAVREPVVWHLPAQSMAHRVSCRVAIGRIVTAPPQIEVRTC